MKLCIFSRSFLPAQGGLERMTELLASQMSRAGHEVEVVTDVTEALPGIDATIGYRITRTRSTRVRRQAFARNDVVLFMNMSLVGLVPAALSPTKIVVSHHGICIPQTWSQFALELLKRQLSRFYPNICVSDFVARHIPGHSVTIANAYDDALFAVAADAPRARDFVFCGRLVSDKGADLLLRAFAAVATRDTSIGLTIVGDGPERRSLEQLAASLQLVDRVRFTGLLTGRALVDELGQHKCMVVPSICEEGFGITALEGIACCDTVIASNRGGLPEAVGRCGLIVEPTLQGLSSSLGLVADAIREGRDLPGRPSWATRAAHLERHKSAVVAARYVDAISQWRAG